MPTLDELRQRYLVRGRSLPAAVERALRDDPRAGAQAILRAIQERRFKNRSEGQRLRNMLLYEGALWRRGTTSRARYTVCRSSTRTSRATGCS